MVRDEDLYGPLGFALGIHGREDFVWCQLSLLRYKFRDR